MQSIGGSGFEAEEPLLVSIVQCMSQHLRRCCELRIKHLCTKNARHIVDNWIIPSHLGKPSRQLGSPRDDLSYPKLRGTIGWRRGWSSRLAIQYQSARGYERKCILFSVCVSRFLALGILKIRGATYSLLA